MRQGLPLREPIASSGFALRVNGRPPSASPAGSKKVKSVVLCAIPRLGEKDCLGEWWNGIHDRLKICWASAHEGSTPSSPRVFEGWSRFGFKRRIYK